MQTVRSASSTVSSRKRILLYTVGGETVKRFTSCYFVAVLLLSQSVRMQEGDGHGLAALGMGMLVYSIILGLREMKP